jgi:hypothetical protein
MTAVPDSQPYIVKRRASIEEFEIEFDFAALTRERAPIIDAARVMKQ